MRLCKINLDINIDLDKVIAVSELTYNRDFASFDVFCYGNTIIPIKLHKHKWENVELVYMAFIDDWKEKEEENGTNSRNN